ncbi:MAG TPA: hypothetical protein VGJ28_01295, partial [Micromonosporaceae bacterium]
NGKIKDANNEDYWRSFVADRRRMIVEISEQIDKHADASSRTLIRAALDAARAQSERIEPIRYVEYLRLWRSDRVRWTDFQAGLPKLDWDGALKHLGLDAPP